MSFKSLELLLTIPIPTSFYFYKAKMVTWYTTSTKVCFAVALLDNIKDLLNLSSIRYLTKVKQSTFLLLTHKIQQIQNSYHTMTSQKGVHLTPLYYKPIISIHVVIKYKSNKEQQPITMIVNHQGTSNKQVTTTPSNMQKELQNIRTIGILLYHTRAVYSTQLTALSTIASTINEPSQTSQGTEPLPEH